jgi:hypothetical protein
MTTLKRLHRRNHPRQLTLDHTRVDPYQRLLEQLRTKRAPNRQLERAGEFLRRIAREPER